MRLWEPRPQTRMRIEDASQVGSSRRAAQRLALLNDFDETLVGRAGIIASELATNVLKHAGGGELLLQAIDDDNGATIEMIAIDRGPGMSVERCMPDGYSTGGTAGTGLGAIRRLSTLFDIYSVPGQGTVALSRLSRQGPRVPAGANAAPLLHAFGAICLAVEGEIECGDTWRLAVEGDSLAIMVADGLGHGPIAASASGSAATAYLQKPFATPIENIDRMHLALSGGRGAAVACALLDRRSANLAYCGVGNIAGVVVSAQRSQGMVSHNGTLGLQMPRKQQFGYAFGAGSRIVMHSDGMSARWTLKSYPGIDACHPSVIAGVLYRDHARRRDDFTVVVTGGIL